MIWIQVREQYAQMPGFERGRVVGLKEARWFNQRIARHLNSRDAPIRRCWIGSTMAEHSVKKEAVNQTRLQNMKTDHVNRSSSERHSEPQIYDHHRLYIQLVLQ